MLSDVELGMVFRRSYFFLIESFLEKCVVINVKKF